MRPDRKYHKSMHVCIFISNDSTDFIHLFLSLQFPFMCDNILRFVWFLQDVWIMKKIKTFSHKLLLCWIRDGKGVYDMAMCLSLTLSVRMNILFECRMLYVIGNVWSNDFIFKGIYRIKCWLLVVIQAGVRAKGMQSI